MTTCTRAMIVAVSTLTALGTLTACSGRPAQKASAVATAEQSTPDSQPDTYITTLAGNEGNSLAMSVAVAGDDVVAYANNGADDEAWFFGTHDAGTVHLISAWQDEFTATFDADRLDGTVILDDVAYTGSASPAAAPAGAYTATMGDARASWIVMPDRTMVGVMTPTSVQDTLVIDRLNAEARAAEAAEVADAAEAAEAAERRRKMMKKMRKKQRDQMKAAPAMSYGTWTVDMMDARTTAIPVSARAGQLPNTG
jgi:hypothetical protein